MAAGSTPSRSSPRRDPKPIFPSPLQPNTPLSPRKLRSVLANSLDLSNFFSPRRILWPLPPSRPFLERVFLHLFAPSSLALARTSSQHRCLLPSHLLIAFRGNSLPTKVSVSTLPPSSSRTRAPLHLAFDQFETGQGPLLQTPAATPHPTHPIRVDLPILLHTINTIQRSSLLPLLLPSLSIHTLVDSPSLEHLPNSTL